MENILLGLKLSYLTFTPLVTLQKTDRLSYGIKRHEKQSRKSSIRLKFKHFPKVYLSLEDIQLGLKVTPILLILCQINTGMSIIGKASEVKTLFYFNNKIERGPLHKSLNIPGLYTHVPVSHFCKFLLLVVSFLLLSDISTWIPCQGCHCSVGMIIVSLTGHKRLMFGERDTKISQMRLKSKIHPYDVCHFLLPGSGAQCLSKWVFMEKVKNLWCVKTLFENHWPT